MNIGYVKYMCYIITIEVHTKTKIPLYLPIHNLEYAYYKCDNFKVLKIDKIGSSDYIQNINYNAKNNYINLEINKTYKYNIDINYHINYKVAFDYNFMELKQYKLFENGYSGFYKIYTFSGLPILEYYHNNGIKEGGEKIYDIKGDLTRTIEWVGGKKNGYEITYHNNIEKTKIYYIDGIKYDG